MTEQEMLSRLYELERENAHRKYPQWLCDMFPLWFVFYRSKSGKPRMRKEVVRACLLSEVAGLRLKRNEKLSSIRKASDGRKYRDIIRLKPLGKNAYLQNSFNVITCLLSSPSDFGTVIRSVKHRGFPKLVAAFYPTQKEIDRLSNSWRYRFTKFKDFDSLYRERGFYDPQFMDLCSRLAETYACNSLGQLKLL